MEGQDLGEIGLDPEVTSIDGSEGQETDAGVDDVGAEGGGDVTSAQGAQTFYDASKVPSELQPTFREMQKAFTQKTQGVADLRRQAALHTQKSVVFDQIMADPRVRSFLTQLDQASDTGSEDLSDVDPVMSQAIERATAPLTQRLSQLQGQLNQQTAFAGFQRSHPDWEQHAGAMQEAWEQDRLAGRPQRSFEDAYNWAYVNQARVGQAAPTSRKAQPRKAVESGGIAKAATPSAPDLKGDRRTAYRNAVDWALAQHGIDRKALSSLRSSRLSTQ
jgi:hypothetical protein